MEFITASHIKRESQINLGVYTHKNLSDTLTMYWKILEAEQEVEVVLVNKGLSYAAVGWRPTSTTTKCREFPAIVGPAPPKNSYIPKSKTSAPAAEPEGEPEGRAEGEPEGEPEGHAEGEPEGEPEGHAEGEPEGQSEGEPEGHVEGHAEGEPEGEPESYAEGEPEAEPNVPISRKVSSSTSKKPKLSLAGKNFIIFYICK